MSKTDSFGFQPPDHAAPSPGDAATGVSPDAQALLQHLPWGVVVLDAHNTVLRLNAQAAYWWGVPQQHVQGKPLSERTAGMLPAELQQTLQRVTSDLEPLPGEFFLPQHQQWIAMSSTRQGDDWVVYWQDITTQKQLESHNLARQAASDALLRRTESVAHTGSYELEIATGYFHFSDGLCQLFGEKPDAFKPDQAQIDARSHPDDVAAVQQVLAQALESRQPYHYLRRIYRSDGQLRILECHGQVDCDALGQPVKLLGLVQDVTEREQAAQELLRVKDELMQRATDNYLALYNSMDEGFCIVEVLFDAAQHPTDYRFLDVNPAFEQQSGLHGVLGKTMRELYPAHEQYWFDIYGRVAQTGEPTRFEARGQALERWFTVNAFPIGDQPNRYVAVLFTDITERKRTEETLRQSEEQFRLLVTATSDTVYRMNADWTQMEQLVSRDFLAETLSPSRTWTADYIPDEDLPLVQAAIADAIARKGPLELEHRVQQADGTVGWAHTRAVPVLDAQGEVTSWLGAASDVSARKQAEEALRVSEEGFRAVANLVPDLLWRSTPDSDTTWYNQQWYEYTGQTTAEAYGYGWTDAIHPDDRAASRHRYHTAVVSGQPLLHEHRIRSAQGEYRWFQVQARPLLSEHGTVTAWYGAATDIHARKLAEEDLRHDEERNRAQLEQQVAERTQALRESHNLLQTVFDASPTAIVVMRLLHDAAGQPEDFEILIFNEFNKQVVGRDDLVGQRFTVMFPQTVPTGILARLLAVATTGKPADFEQWYEGEGMRHWFRHIVVRQGDLLVLTSEVVTARKLLEQAQDQSFALLQQSESVASMGSWEYDLHTQKFTWSDGLYHLLERPVGSTIKLQFFLDVVLDDDRPAAARLMRTLTTGASAFDTTLRLRIGDVVKTVRFKAVPLPEAPGPPERVLGVCLDVSDVQRLEAENLALRLDRHKELLLAILQAQETERQRLGEVLHNGLGQVLYATKLHLDQLDTPALHAQPDLSGLYRQTGRLLADAMRQTRTLAHELVPTSILQYGLAAAVRDVCRDLSTPQLVVQCHVWGEAQMLPQAVQVTLFRLAQELVHNIVRHAQATQATLELETLPGGVSLRAEDNGHGFDSQSIAEGLGLRTVRDAVTLLNGTMAVDSSPEFGTHIRLRIPLPLFSQP